MNITNWIQAVSAGVAAIVTIVLARITYIYVRETKRIAKSSEKQTELSLRPFVVITVFQDNVGMSRRLVYKNIGHSPAIDVLTDPFDEGSFIIEFKKHGLIDTGEFKELSPKGKGKETLGDVLIQSVPTPSFVPKDLAERDSDLELILNIYYKNLERVSYITRVKINRVGIEILSTEKQ